MGLRALLISPLLLSTLCLYAQAPGSMRERIDSAIVTSAARTDGISKDASGSVCVSLETLNKFPKILGESDPFKYLQSLPGVSTAKDNTAGLVVQGYDIGQTFTRICDAPVYGHGHIMGLFSVFNPSHFQKMSFTAESDYGNIGGMVTMDTAELPADSLHARFNLSPVATHFSLSAPLGKKSSLTVSARRTFVDIFYKNLLLIGDYELDYHFYDLNASFISKIGPSDLIDANFYTGKDDCGNIVLAEGSSISSIWGDTVGNVRWRHDSGDLKMTTQLFASRYGSLTGWHEDSLINELSGGISDIGFSSHAVIRDNWHAGLTLDRYALDFRDEHDEAWSAGLELGWEKKLDDFSLGLFAKPSIYADRESGKFYFSPDPQLSLEYNLHHSGMFSLNIRGGSQNLFFVGPTSGGFPSEFWIAAGKYSDPQHSLSLNLGYDLSLADDMFKFTVDAYGHRLWNQLEYYGMLTDLKESSVCLDEVLLKTTGVNFGGSIMLEKTSGDLTGRVSYTAGRALRSTDGQYWFPSSHERIHELNAVASYKLGRWDFGTSIVFASGQPFTPAVSAFILNEELIVEYGPTNSGRLKPYFRWDASASFNIHDSGRFRDGINISVLNLTARQNDILASLKLEEGNYSFSSVFLVIPIMPSINYYCSF